LLLLISNFKLTHYRILNTLGVDAARAMESAGSPEIKARLKAQTEEAMAREIFGAPFFMVGDEPFWGNDRLEEAVAFAAHSEEVNK
jgi:2-hydroxychromene-2-carboxylate isomerase